jgi:predicted dehydrogenase
MIRAAIVGVSGYGRWHLLMAMEQALLGRLKLVGATVINPLEQAGVCRRLARHGVPLFNSCEEMLVALKGQIDLLMVPTAIHWHAPMTIAALRAGLHVLLEKPVAGTVQEVDAIIAAQAEASRIVAVGFQDLYVPATLDIKRRVLDGDIGTLQRVVVRGQWPRSSAYYGRNEWAGRLRVGEAWVLDSPVSNAFAHFLMMALFWSAETLHGVAEVAEVSAELYRAAPIESFDTACMRARTTRGIEILFYGSHAGAEEFPPEVQLVGDKGSIAWTYETFYTVTRERRPVEVLPVPNQLDTRLSVLDTVMDRLEGKSGFIVDPALGREHTRLMNALHDFFPIHTVGPANVSRLKSRTGVFSRIRDLDQTVAAAAERNLLFSETRAAWTVPAGPAQTMKNYRKFQGDLGECAGRPSN